jgi:hypothetical protein
MGATPDGCDVLETLGLAPDEEPVHDLWEHERPEHWSVLWRIDEADESQHRIEERELESPDVEGS